MKSPTMLEAIKPLSRLEDAERKAHKVKHDEWMLESELEKMAADFKMGEAKNLATTDRKKA